MRGGASLVLLAGLLLAVLLLAGGCGGGREAPPHVELAYRVEADTKEVAPGRGFQVDVVRGWRKTLLPEAFDPRSLSPLTLQPLGVDRLEDDTHVQETLRFRAHAFTLRDVILKGLVLRAVARGGGPEHEVVADPLRLGIRPELPVETSPPELPEALRLPASPPWRLLLGGGLLLVLGGLALGRARRPAAAPSAPRAVGKEARDALERVDDVAAMADVLRDYVAARFAYDAPRRTTDEVAQAGAAGHLPHAEGLVHVLRAGDASKFAAARPDPAEREAVRAQAVRYVQVTEAAP